MTPRERYIEEVRARMADETLSERDARWELHHATTRADILAEADDVAEHYEDVRRESDFASSIAGYLERKITQEDREPIAEADAAERFSRDCDRRRIEQAKAEAGS